MSLSKCTYFTVDGYYRRNVPTSPSTGTTVSSKCIHFTVPRVPLKCVTVEVSLLHRPRVPLCHRRSVPTSPSTGTIVEMGPLHRRRVLSSKWAHFTVDGYYGIVEVYLLHRRRVLPYRRSVSTSPSTGTTVECTHFTVHGYRRSVTVEVYPHHRQSGHRRSDVGTSMVVPVED